MNTYDVSVIGSGPGGYIAAIRCAQLGKKVAIVERYPTLGGTCLNVGCIPSKALLDSSEHYYNAEKNCKTHGIELTGLRCNFKSMRKRKDKLVSQTTDGVRYLMDKNGIDVYTGWGSFRDATQLQIKKEGGDSVEIQSAKTIIATGSKPGTLPFLPLDKKRVISSTEALDLKEIPEHLLVIGGGAIGLELGSVYRRLGSQVTVIEYADRIIPTMDAALSKELMKCLKKRGFAFELSTQVTGATVQDDKVSLEAKDKKGKSLSFTADYCLLAVGRKPYTEGLGLERVGVQTDDRGFIGVDEHWQTQRENIYAIGDVTGGAMLAHKAEEEGVAVAEHIDGQKPHIDYNLIPHVVYTWPEVAAVGQTESQLEEAGIAYKSGEFPMRALGRARASGDVDGAIKVLADEKTDEVLGVHMVGARAADLIVEAVVAMEFRASAEDIGRICHPHPTYSEAVKEAALDAFNGRPLNR
ncbi:MAG: dihydrolipoyl dehydrogenase [Flavobacteriales bacterium]